MVTRKRKIFKKSRPQGRPFSDGSFRPPFSKGGGGLGQSPKSRPQARNLSNAVFWFFFAATPSKKNGESFLNVTCPNSLPAFFFDTSGAEEIASHSEAAWQKRNAEKVSRLRARRGLCPRPATFLKKGRSKTFLLCGGFVWVKAGANFHQGRVRMVAVICGTAFL